MPVTYEAWLVLLSIVMAIQGAYVGLSLALQIASASGARRRLLLAGATVSFAVAIWTMHFVGMLAVRLPFQVDYLVLPDGRRYFCHALSRHERARRQHAHGPRPCPCRRQHGDCHRGVRTGALVGYRPGMARAAHSVGRGLRCGDLG